jgi:signal peptidase I
MLKLYLLMLISTIFRALHVYFLVHTFLVGIICFINLIATVAYSMQHTFNFQSYLSSKMFIYADPIEICLDLYVTVIVLSRETKKS